jgi:hypothetical protein
MRKKITKFIMRKWVFIGKMKLIPKFLGRGFAAETWMELIPGIR